MHCAWELFLNLLPLWLRPFVDRHGREDLQELRLRMGSLPELILSNGSIWGEREVDQKDISYCVNAASQYSPWAATTVSQGFITAPGGHRIGICGQATVKDGSICGIRRADQLCMRVARDFQGIAKGAAALGGSTLIIGPPGSGKSTLLRDLIRCISDNGIGSVAVVDERGELFPCVQDKPCFYAGMRTDILSGCRKAEGVQMVLRTMGPATIAVDEITAAEDCEALVHAGWCGVRLLATAHAGNREDMQNRPVYKALADSCLFDNLIVLQKDKSWKLERMV